MGVFQRNPHGIWLAVKTPAWTDENGNRHPGTTTWERVSDCDIVPGGEASQKDFGDGVMRSYAYTVHLPLSCRDLTLNDSVRLEMYGKTDTTKTYTVKGFHRYQTYCVLWI